MSRSRIETFIEDFISKAKGEGTRGGKIIGHTRSGKPVYASKRGTDISYRAFSHDDHMDASRLHGEAYSRAHKNFARAWGSKSGLGDSENGEIFSDRMRVANAAMRHHTNRSLSHKSAAVGTEIIGKTASGKNVHAGGAGHPAHDSFTAHDHLDAVVLHRNLENQHKTARRRAYDLAVNAPPKHQSALGRDMHDHDRAAYNHRKNADDHLNSLRHLVGHTDEDS